MLFKIQEVGIAWGEEKRNYKYSLKKGKNYQERQERGE